MRRWKSKTGAVEIQFNWIFVLIIGSMIIVFFVMIAQKQKQASDKSLAADILSDMELIFTGQSVSVGREDVLIIPDIPIDISCADFSMMGIPKELGQTLLFAPTRIEGDELITWTLSFDVPFKVANFMYMTSADDKYYFIVADPVGGIDECASSDPDDDTLWGPIIDSERNLQLGEILPLRLDVKCIHVSDLTGLSYEKNPYVKFVFLENAFSSLPVVLPTETLDEFKKARVSVMAIEDTTTTAWEKGGTDIHLSRVDDIGSATYSMGSFPAFGAEAVIGAIFSSDYETYECVMGRAIKRMQNVAKVYKERSQRLQDHFADQDCGYRSQNPGLFDSYITFPTPGGAIDIDADQVESLFALGDGQLRSIVKNAQRYSCPTMY